MRIFKIASRVGLISLLTIGAVWLTTPLWATAIGRSLICSEDVAPSDAMLLENFDPNFLVFERAAELEKAGLSRMAFVPVEASEPPALNPVSMGIADVMVRQARLRSWRAIPILQTEPITLNAAVQIRPRLAAEKVTSVMILTPLFRSQRSLLVYRATFGPHGIIVRCVPVSRGGSPASWTKSWHGVQQVLEEFIKLQYYRFYVLPFRTVRGAGAYCERAACGHLAADPRHGRERLPGTAGGGAIARGRLPQHPMLHASLRQHEEDREVGA
jgi:hypothetical protein